jgi:hypothetical protein
MKLLKNKTLLIGMNVGMSRAANNDPEERRSEQISTSQD